MRRGACAESDQAKSRLANTPTGSNLSRHEEWYYGQPTEVVSTLTGLNTPSGPRKNQIARLAPLPFPKVTLKALLTRPGWKTVVWPRF